MTKHIRMPKEIADKWLAALRSGGYKQGQLKLRVHDMFCCLGVLEHCVSGEVENSALPSMEWLKNNNIEFLSSPINQSKPDITPYISSVETYIHNINDDYAPFSKIADLIESELEYTDGEGK